MIHKRLLTTAAAALLSLPLAISATPDNPTYPAGPPSGSLYDVANPYSYFELDETLNSISGISPTNDPRTIVAVKDEEGKAYFIDKKSGKITKDVFFVTEGQFEGIEMVGQDIFAVKESGILYKISNLSAPSRTVKMLRTGLPRTELISGLAYDLHYNQLLMTAKGQKEGEFSRKIYAYDLKTNTTSTEPMLEITLAAFKEFLTQNSDKQYAKLREDFVDKNNGKGFDFMPTSIAVHPITGNIYMVSAENNVLLTVDRSGKIVDMLKLKKEHFNKVEGICFDEEGTMFLSNEAKDGKPARLFTYKMQSAGMTARR